MNRSTRIRPESADPFAMQLALSRIHARLVPMQRVENGYALDPIAEDWIELPAGRGFAGYGLGRALRMLLDVLRGLTALHDTFDTEGVDFAHGEVTLTQFRVDHEGVCRLVPLTARHSSAGESTPPIEALGHLAPERLLEESVDARADVFSAGVLLWEALAGRRLFIETTVDAIVERLMGEKLPVPQLPPELAWAIPLKSIAARAMAVDPYQRFADCAELATAIAIVARERVATHGEIAAFFGAKARSLNSVAQQRPRPIPTRSSTFPSVNVPVGGINAPPSSRNGFPLATPAPRAVTSAPRSLSPVPRSLSPVPRSLSPVPRAVTIPGPMSAARAPETTRAATHKSPFTTLLGTGGDVPASHRRKTLIGVGTPFSALNPVDAEPASARPPSSVPPAVPVWEASMPTAPASQAPTASVVVARATLESISLSAEEVAAFQRWPSRRSLIALALLAIAGVAVALIATRGSNDAADDATKGPERAQLAAPGSGARRAAVPESADPSAARTTTTPSTTDPKGVPASAPKEPRPAVKAASPTKPPTFTVTKDYGI